MTKHVHSSQKPLPDPDAEKLAWLDPSTMEVWTRAASACTDACRLWQEEIIRFTSSRLERDADFARKLTACRDWKQAAKLQQEWAATLSQDYLEESNRLLEMASKLGADIIESAPGTNARHT